MKLKKLFVVATVCLMAAGCAKLGEFEKEINGLNSQVSSMEQRISTLETIVAALQAGDYITAIETVSEGGKTGYKITFNKYGTVTVFDGANGKDGDAMFQKVEVGEEEVKFTMTDGTEFSIPRYASDHLNLPNGVIMVSKEFDDVIKGDQIILNVIVNPSDFKIDKEHIGFLALHDIYTKYNTTYNSETQEEIEDPFDETAHCDLTVTECVQSQEYEGGYQIAVAISGEGNFFDDITLYMLYGDKDHTGKDRFICSNTPAKVHVIPMIEEGLTADFIDQSLYGISLEKKAKSEEMKPVIGGLWISHYKNAVGLRRVYDRDKITAISCGSDEMANSFAVIDTLFKGYGLLSIDTIKESEFWTNTIKDYTEKGDFDYVTIPEGGLKVDRGTETHTFPLTNKLYFENFFEHIISTTGAELKEAGNKIVIDVTDDFKKDGWDTERKLSDYYAQHHSSGTIGSRMGSDLDMEAKTLTLSFWNTRPTTETEPCESYDLQFIVIRGEDKDGTARPISSTEPEVKRSYEVSYILEKTHIDITE